MSAKSPTLKIDPNGLYIALTSAWIPGPDGQDLLLRAGTTYRGSTDEAVAGALYMAPAGASDREMHDLWVSRFPDSPFVRFH